MYGTGTRSYNRSTEHRESKRQQAEATAEYLATPRVEIVVPLICTCRSFRFAHPPARHGTLKHPADWTPWQQRYRLDREHNALVEITGASWRD